jgi:hypothetical protein
MGSEMRHTDQKLCRSLEKLKNPEGFRFKSKTTPGTDHVLVYFFGTSTWYNAYAFSLSSAYTIFI